MKRSYPQNALAEKSSEWYTRPKYIEAARRVMGSIDLDPASDKEANAVVKAQKIYTKEDNGLLQPWYGHVWLNPPFGRSPDMKAQHQSTIDLFIGKLISEYQSGNVEQAILLATAQIDARWFQPLWQYPICFSDHRVRFYRTGNATTYSQMFGTIFVYLGSNEQEFTEVFSQFGRIAKAIDIPKMKPTNLELWSA